MININEKKELTPGARDWIIHVLDTGYQRQEPLALHINVFDEYEVTRAQRNEIILESDYALDEGLVAAITLFGY